ncbi:hypothetical protein [Erwinia mallotivora]|uniref:hypothetical protein n=1 Tax=Erwinia mallotivora TaxID=69222 RepID=UPI0021BFA922|nr:hypothetical protein [Erwinia mallotivora]
MNNIDYEQKLAENGFTAKDIAAMRQYLGQDGATYPSLLGELRVRFITSCIIIAIIIAGLIYTLLYENSDYLFGYILAMIITGPIFYFMTPMKLGCKAFLYKMKN